jgi:putative addiction module component (TIGR02574 family)
MNLANETRGHAADAIWEGAAPCHAATPDQTAGVRLCSPPFPDLPIRGAPSVEDRWCPSRRLHHVFTVNRQECEGNHRSAGRIVKPKTSQRSSGPGCQAVHSHHVLARANLGQPAGAQRQAPYQGDADHRLRHPGVLRGWDERGRDSRRLPRPDKGRHSSGAGFRRGAGTAPLELRTLKLIFGEIVEPDDPLAERPAYTTTVSLSEIDIATLTPEERLDLLEQLWESLTPTPDAVPLTDAQRAELDRRLDDLDREGSVGLSWDEVIDRVRDRRR